MTSHRPDHYQPYQEGDAGDAVNDGGGVEPDEEHSHAQHRVHDGGDAQYAAHPPLRRGHRDQSQTGQREAQGAGDPADGEQYLFGSTHEDSAGGQHGGSQRFRGQRCQSDGGHAGHRRGNS